MKNSRSDVERRKKYTLNGVTHYVKNNIPCYCASKRYKSAEEKAEARAHYTDKRVESESVFGVVSATIKAMFRALGDRETWTCFTREMKTTGRSLSLKLNTPCFDKGGVFNFRAYVFNVGWLANPLYTRVRRERWTVTLEWTDRCNRRANRGTDKLMIGYFFHSYPNAPQVMIETGVTRADGKVTFTIPPERLPREDMPEDELLHFYPYFTRPDLSGSSRSLYIRGREGMDEEL